MLNFPPRTVWIHAKYFKVTINFINTGLQRLKYGTNTDFQYLNENRRKSLPVNTTQRYGRQELKLEKPMSTHNAPV